MISLSVNRLLEELGFKQVSPHYRENIALWEQFFKGKVKDFHTYQEWNGHKNVTRQRNSLQMAKKVCEDWADVLYNPETEITVDESYQDRLQEIFEYNDFESQINFNLERGYALGTLGIVTTLIGKMPTIQFITADMMYPAFDSQGHFAWIIVSEPINDLFYISIHYESTKANGRHRVVNHIARKEEGRYHFADDSTLKKEYNVSPVRDYAEPMLHIIKPAIANNLDFRTPYGVSVFANAIDELKAVDIAFSSLTTELETGKMLIFSMVENLENIDGNMVFPDSEGFYVMEGQNTYADGTTIKTHSPTLRSTEIIDTLETQLNLLGRKAGFGDNAYTFQEGSIYTNTAQVVSTNSKFFKTRQKHLVVVEEALRSMVKAIYLLDKDSEYKGEVDVYFDDSIIHDKQQEDKELDFQLMNGLISEVYYWQQKLGLDEENAIQFVKKQQELKNLDPDIEEEGGEE